jgi:hypothetical protein
LKQYMLDVDVELYQDDMPKLSEALRAEGYGDVLMRLENSNLSMHAPWLKKGDEEHELIKGWDSVVARLNSLAHKIALAEAIKALEQDFTEENAQRLAALQKQG